MCYKCKDPLQRNADLDLCSNQIIVQMFGGSGPGGSRNCALLVGASCGGLLLLDFSNNSLLFFSRNYLVQFIWVLTTKSSWILPPFWEANPEPWGITRSCLGGAWPCWFWPYWSAEAFWEGSGTFDNPSVKHLGFELSTELFWFPV